MDTFSHEVRGWFLDMFEVPTEVQTRAWDTIAQGRNALVVAPTGSGKTFAAFLQAIDALMCEKAAARQWRRGVRVLYVSPLKALGADVERNLAEPLRDIAVRTGCDVGVDVGVRTGDTTAAERQRLNRRPPDILITTPESLYLMLTSQAREMFKDLQTVIVDEIHSLAGSKRGAHLSLSLERLDVFVGHPVQRVGLSATVEPREEVARFLGGVHAVEVIAADGRTDADIRICVPVQDMTAIPRFGDNQKVSIWPYLESAILDEVLRHTSTIVFVNSRGLCERLTAHLNDRYARRTEGARGKVLDAELAGPIRSDIGSTSELTGASAQIIAKAHHGSVAKEKRVQVERELKTGALRCVVATSSLELGIDMGEVDLVIQVAPPPSVSSGLQRIGRANHRVAGKSEGIMFPRVRTEVLDCAVVVEGMVAGHIERTHLINCPLDILAQQTVAEVSLCTEGLSADEWFQTVKRSACFTTLARSAFDAVIQMLSGVFATGEVAEFAPRIRVEGPSGLLMPLPRSQRLAVSAGGTIPDRGLFPVMLPEGDAARGRRRVGELDEEMVHESRVGDRIILGTSTWRIIEIGRDRVLVEPAPGQAARLPFWHGENVGRSFDAGMRRGAFVRQLVHEDADAVETRLIADGLDAFARDNLRALVEQQRQATGVLPDDHTVVIEQCADEQGDERIIIHATFGKRVCEPWALALATRVRAHYGFDPQAMAADDGIVLRIPEAHDAALDREAFLFDPDEIERIVCDTVGSTALFAARFRECAARALLVTPHQPGTRAPLWQQRIKGGQLLEAARRQGDFPLLAETARECLQDVYDLPSLRQMMQDVAEGSLQVHLVRTQTPSPFAAPLLFGYVAEHLYEGDLPHAEQRRALLSVDAGLLRELLGGDKTAEILDEVVVARVQAELQHEVPGYRMHGSEGAHELLRRLGPLSRCAVAARLAADASAVRALDGSDPLGAAADEAACSEEEAQRMLDALDAAHRAFRTRVGAAEVWVAAEDAARLNAVLGVRGPSWAPSAHAAADGDDLLDGLVARIVQTNVLSSASGIAESFGIGAALVEESLCRLAAQGRARRVSAPGDAAQLMWADPAVLRRVRARSLAAARKAVEPVSQEAYLRFLFDLQGIDVAFDTDSLDRLAEVIAQFEGVALPASLWESAVFPARVRAYQPALLDELLSEGEVIWVGGTDADGHRVVSFYPADSPLCPVRAPWYAGGEQAKIAEAAWQGGVSSDRFTFVRASCAGQHGQQTSAPPPAPRRAMSRRSARRYSELSAARRAARERVVARSAHDAAFAGTWWALKALPTNDTMRALEMVDSLLERFGIIARDIALGAGVPGGLSGIYPVLRSREDAGELLRGAFVEGLGPAQFALMDSIERIRSFADASDDATIVLDADDPANLFGAGLAWPDTGSAKRPVRRSGALVVFCDGQLVLYASAHARDLISFDADEALLVRAIRALADELRARLRRPGALRERIQVRTFDGQPVLDSPAAGMLEEAGFARNGLELRLYAQLS